MIEIEKILTEKQIKKIEQWSGRFARFRNKRWVVEWELEILDLLRDLGFIK